VTHERRVTSPMMIQHTWKSICDIIAVGDENQAMAAKIGTVRLEVHQQNGERSIVLLKGCKYVRELRDNIFSITQALTWGWTLSNRGVRITLSKQQGDEYGQTVFNTIDPGTSGIVMMVKMVPCSTSTYKHLKTQGISELALDFRSINKKTSPLMIPQPFSHEEKIPHLHDNLQFSSGTNNNKENTTSHVITIDTIKKKKKNSKPQSRAHVTNLSTKQISPKVHQHQHSFTHMTGDRNTNSNITDSHHNRSQPTYNPNNKNKKVLTVQRR
jgi:hypothetical protein